MRGVDEVESYDIVSSYMVRHVKEAMQRVSPEERKNLSEVRLRSGQALSFVYPGRNVFLCQDGRLSDSPGNNSVILSHEDIRNTVAALSRYSVHSHSRELTQGYFVIENGIRVGVSGVFSETVPPVLRDFSGLNFRLSRQIPGCAAEIFRLMFRSGGSVLICGGVNSGKTTVLRDLCRLCSQHWKAALIDERGEIAFNGNGIDIGPMTDVLTGCTRSTGINMAVRTLSPDIIFCDEITASEDSAAIMSAYGCGARFAATIHAASYDDLLRRTVSSELLSAGVFSHAVMLAGSSFPGKISEIRRLSRA